MMKIWRKIIWALTISCVCTLAAVMPVWAITPRKVAVLPPINTAKYRYAGDFQIIQDRIREPFKYPYYELIAMDKAAAAAHTFAAAHPKAKLSDEYVLARLADDLAADIIVVVEVSRVGMTEISDIWHGDYYIKSDIELKCYAYSSGDKKYDVVKVSVYGIEPMGVNTTAPAYFKELAEQILIKLPYKRIPVDENLAGA